MGALRPTIPIYRGYTHAEISLIGKTPYSTAVGDWCREHLAEKEFIPTGKHWNKERHCLVYEYAHWVLKRMYCKYNKETGRLHIPICFADDVKKILEDYGCEVRDIQLPDYPLRKINVKMNASFTDRPWQIKLIEKCSETTRGMKGLAMQTGKGKTYCATKSWVNLGYAGIVIVGGLTDQWVDSIREQTDITTDEIYKIEGFESLAGLAQHPTFRPAMFVASHRTMQIFCNGENDYDLLPWDYRGFLKEYGIGVKIVDECHLKFHANTMMDLEANVPYNLYCSATFTQNDKRAREIFRRVFPDEIQYGMSAYDRYVTSFIYHYRGEVIEKRCIGPKGYSHARYEKELRKSEQKFNYHIQSLYVPMINQHYLNRRIPDKGHKMLIMCSTIEFIDCVVTKLRKLYPDLRINSYIGGSENEILKQSDIIVSNAAKSGTGLDLRGLITLMNTVSVQSPPMIEQVFGRLRRADGIEMQYIDRCDDNLERHKAHAEERFRIVKRLSCVYHEYKDLNDTVGYTYTAPTDP